jgi:carbamoyltransferase
MYILGLSGFAHDPAAALLADNGIVAAIEESKVVRTRAAGGIPREAVHYVLQRGHIDWRDLGCIAVASRPWRNWMRQALFRARLTPFAPIQSSYYQTKSLGELARELNNRRIVHLLGDSSKLPVLQIEHHLCHAASAFYASPSDRALVLTLDERGDGWAGSVALGEGSQLRGILSIPFPHSLGWIFSQITDLIGFTSHRDEHKTQWLGLECEPAFEALFLKMMRRAPGDPPHLEQGYFNRGFAGDIAFSPRFYRDIGVDPISRKTEVRSSPRVPLSDSLRCQLASSVQSACATIITEMAEHYRKRTGTKDLCLAGGVFLNPVLVSEVEKNTGFNHVFLQPAAGNEGTALGAAWYVRHHVQEAPKQAAIQDLYWGPSYSDHEVKAVLDNCKTCYHFHNSEDQKLQETVRLLNAGKIVGWYQGAAEFGPRALGNRSLLASPWAPYVKENLNQYVKHREAFRPFAICVPAERAAELFDITPAARFMGTLSKVRPEMLDLLAGFLLPGNRVRLHVVERTANSALWNLLNHFGREAPAPVLVNTSFNLFGEPLVISPRDAVRSYFCSGIDALVIGSFTLSK